MNCSMQDTYNLGWKIALVAKHICTRDILKTYHTERRQVAQDLIEFDRKFARLFSGRPNASGVSDTPGVSMDEFKSVFLQGQLFASGLSVNYDASMLIAKSGNPQGQDDGTQTNAAPKERVVGKQELAKNISLGMRFPSFQVLNQADARPWHFQEWLRSDGRFRLIIFAGNVGDAAQKARLKTLCAKLGSQDSFLRRFTPPDQPIDSIIEILTLHSAPRQDVELLEDFPALLHPFDEVLGHDYDKVFVDDACYHAGHGHAYQNYGVASQRGCIVAVRPDQHVGFIGELEDTADLDYYFDGFLVSPSS